MKYDVVTSHMNTQHWIVEAPSKDMAAQKVMSGDIKWDKTSRKYVSNKLTMGLVTIPDATIRSVEPLEQTQGFDNVLNLDDHENDDSTLPLYEGTDPE